MGEIWCRRAEQSTDLRGQLLKNRLHGNSNDQESDDKASDRVGWVQMTEQGWAGSFW